MKPDHPALKCYCQRCGAPPGRACVTPAGRPMKNYHVGGYRTIGRLHPPGKMLVDPGYWATDPDAVLIPPPAPRRPYPLRLWPMRAMP